MTGWLLAGAVLAVLLVGAPTLQAYLALHPPGPSTDLVPTDVGLRYEAVRFEAADGVELAGWWVPAERPTTTAVVVGHGYPMDKSDVLPAARFLREDHHLLFVDLRSFGDSGGQATTLGRYEARDVRAAITYALNRPEVERVAAWGFSLSATAALLADDDRAACLVAEAPFADLPSLARTLHGDGPVSSAWASLVLLAGRVVFGFDAREVDVPARVDRRGPPVLVVHGTRDEQVPLEHGERVHEALGARSTLWRVTGAGHGAAQAVDPAAYRERVRGFLREHLGDGAGDGPGP